MNKILKNKKTYSIITIGCQMNQSDSERLAAFLDNNGFKAVEDFKAANVVIINTCGIRQPAEDRAYGLVNQINKYNPTAKVVIAGCLSKRSDVKKRLTNRADIFLPINEMLQLPGLLEGKEYEPYFSLDDVRLKAGEKYLDILPSHESKFTAYVPIGNGCNNFCSYCVVPYARGREVYRPASEIIKEVQFLIGKGYKEIILIAQNVNSYSDTKYNFPKLLAQLIKIPGKFWLRFSSSHPKDLSDELMAVMGSSLKVCSHLHLAVQSGDDKILKAMNRQYTASHYKNLIKKMRVAKPGIAITTDVIVGFPGETKTQFNQTLKLFKDLKFDLAYILEYSQRPGTVSSKMLDNVSWEEKSRRARSVNEVLKQTALLNNEKYLGKTLEILVEGKNRKGNYYGKASTYQTVVIKGINNKDTKNLKKLIGNFVKVKIIKALSFGLEAELVAE